MQQLYETHKVLTYPRTDSRYLTSDVVGTIGERLEACGRGPTGSWRPKSGGRSWTEEAFLCE